MPPILPPPQFSFFGTADWDDGAYPITGNYSDNWSSESEYINGSWDIFTSHDESSSSDLTRISVFDLNGLVSFEWSQSRQVSSEVINPGLFSSGVSSESELSEYISSCGEVQGTYYSKSISSNGVTIIDVASGVSATICFRSS
jgi:hypothetical protein